MTRPVFVPHWRLLFSDDFLHSLSLRFASLTSLHESVRFDAPFSFNELVAALSKWHESGLGADCLPYSLFKVSFSWWRHHLLSCFNLVLRFAVVRPLGSPALLFRLSSAMVAPLLLIPIVPFLSPKFSSTWSVLALRPTSFHNSTLGFHWGADAVAFSLVDTFPIIDIKKAFDCCWVETTLVRLFDFGVTEGLWHLLAYFLCGTLSQVRLGGSVSSPWVDSGIAQGRILSQVDSLTATLRSAIPGVSLASDSFRRLPVLC